MSESRRFQSVDLLSSAEGDAVLVRRVLTDIASELEPRPGLELSERDLEDLARALTVARACQTELVDLAATSPQVVLHCRESGPLESAREWSERYWKPVRGLWSSPFDAEYGSLWQRCIADRGDIVRNYNRATTLRVEGCNVIVLGDLDHAVGWLGQHSFRDRTAQLRRHLTADAVAFSSLLVAEAEVAVALGQLGRGSVPSGLGCESWLWLRHVDGEEAPLRGAVSGRPPTSRRE